ncbi:hypothetical protein ACX80E_00960 [Arthrobacter sp. TMN-49]
MSIAHKGPRWLGVAAALLLATAVPAPAQAKLDPGTPTHVTQVSVSPQCALRRIERQLTRCDSLTGAGVLAPLWVPE